MPLVNIVIALIIVGVVLGLINRYIPMAGGIKSILTQSSWSPYRFGFYKQPDFGLPISSYRLAR